MVMINPGNDAFVAAFDAAQRALQIKVTCGVGVSQTAEGYYVVFVSNAASFRAHHAVQCGFVTAVEDIQPCITRYLARAGITEEPLVFLRGTQSGEFRNKWTLVHVDLSTRLVDGVSIERVYNPT